MGEPRSVARLPIQGLEGRLGTGRWLLNPFLRRRMLANVEIKARVRELARLVSSAERLSGSPSQVLVQTDVFFTVPRGRLKLRRFGVSGAEEAPGSTWGSRSG